MYILKGFLAFGPLTNNSVGVTSPIGEISTDSLTYSRETGLYKRPQYPDTMLYSFFSQKQADQPIPIPTHHVDKILNYGQTLFYQSQSGTINSHTHTSLEEFKRRFVDEFKLIEFGPMQTNGNQWLPEYIHYTPANSDDVITLWLSDQAFSTQYDEYEYALIPPVDELDVFHRTRFNVELALRSRTLQSIFSEIERVRENNPFTVLDTVSYRWMNPDGTGDHIDTHWTILIYGRYGQNTDRIRRFVAEWILKRSIFNENQWVVRFPDIFNPTEFILLPLWHQFAIPNQTIQAGFHSPMTTLEEAYYITKHLVRGNGYDDSVLQKNTVVTTSPNRSLAFLAIGSEHNHNRLTDFRKIYPDYIGFPPSDIDFNRLNPQTQLWIREYINLLIVAETMSRTSLVPKGYGRVIRSERVYALRTIEDMTYLMITRASAIEHLGIVAPYDPEFEDTDDDYCNIGARIIREHLLYEHNAHNVTREQVDLDMHTGVKLLTGGVAKDWALEAFSTVGHSIDYSNVHSVTAAQVGLSDLSNESIMTTRRVLVLTTLELTSLLM